MANCVLVLGRAQGWDGKGKKANSKMTKKARAWPNNVDDSGEMFEVVCHVLKQLDMERAIEMS